MRWAKKISCLPKDSLRYTVYTMAAPTSFTVALIIAGTNEPSNGRGPGFWTSQRRIRRAGGSTLCLTLPAFSVHRIEAVSNGEG